MDESFAIGKKELLCDQSVSHVPLEEDLTPAANEENHQTFNKQKTQKAFQSEYNSKVQSVNPNVKASSDNNVKSIPSEIQVVEYAAPAPEDRSVGKGHFYLSLILVTITLTLAVNGINQPYQILMGSMPSYTQTIFIVLIIVSSLALVYYLCALYYVNKHYARFVPKPHRKIFSMISIFIALLFAVCGGLSLRSNSSLLDSCKDSYTQIWNESFQSAYTGAVDNLCTSKCTCDLKFPSLFQDAFYTTIASSVSTSGVISYPKCSSFSSQTETSNTIKQIENKWGCSGICTRLSMYYFTDINRGSPSEKRSCFQVAVEDKLPILMRLILKSSFATCAGLILAWTFYYLSNDPYEIAEQETQKKSGNSSNPDEEIQSHPEYGYDSWKKDQQIKHVEIEKAFETYNQQQKPDDYILNGFSTKNRTKIPEIEMQNYSRNMNENTTKPQGLQQVDSTLFQQMIKQHRYSNNSN